MNIENRINHHFTQHIQAVEESKKSLNQNIANAVQLITNSIKTNNKILSCGNGGSSGDASHLASELINRFEIERPAIAAIALTTDSAVITSIANDYHYNNVFSRQIEALGNKNDILIVFSTSGNSANVISAIKTAHQKQLKVIACTGKDGGEIKNILQEGDVEICVPNQLTSRIQEIHLIIIHTICDLIDTLLFNNS